MAKETGPKLFCTGISSLYNTGSPLICHTGRLVGRKNRIERPEKSNRRPRD